MSDYTRDSGGEALGARLRRLSARIDQEATQVYVAVGIPFQQRWFGVLNQLRLSGPASVGELAERLGIRHVSVSQTRRSLESEGLTTSTPDKVDSRRNLLSLTPKGEALVRELTPVWDAMIDVSRELNEEAGDVVRLLDRLEDALEGEPLPKRVAAKLGDRLAK